MKQKQTLVILAAIGLFMAIFWIVVLIVVVKTLRGPSVNETEFPVIETTLCDENASDLCIVNFGANSQNRMIINFRLPNEYYATFYVKAKNRDTVSVYTCEVDEFDPIAVRCKGVRTPLGETIDIEVYTTDEDRLIARGTFVVSAIAISTPISLPSEVPVTEEALTEETPTEEFITEEVPTGSFPTEETPTVNPTTEEVPTEAFPTYTETPPTDEGSTPNPDDEPPPDPNSTPPS